MGAIERGEINPTLRIVLKVVSGLDVGLDELVRVFLRQLDDPPAPRRGRRRTRTDAGGADESHS